MRTVGAQKKQHSKKALIAFGLSFGLVFSQVFAISIYRKQTAIKVDAADYSGVSGGFTRSADGTVSASFQVTNNGLDMKGWLLCLFESKPSIDSSNKLTNSNDAHPYSYSACKHYFFASNTSQTGSITVSWSGTSGDQKDNWTSSTSTGASGKTLKDYINNGTNWHLIIGPDKNRYEDQREFTLPAKGHIFGDLIYEWSEDYTTCHAYGTCVDCEISISEDVTCEVENIVTETGLSYT